MHRRALIAVSALLPTGLAACGATVAHSVSSTSTTSPRTPSTAATQASAPVRPGSLAVGPNGDLYVADQVRNQILERLPDGTFVVVAGNGKPGFSGDDGPALNAELNDPGGMAFAKNGDLYFADQDNDRVRRISPSGTITTVLGSGRPIVSNRGEVVRDGMSALKAVVRPNDVAFSPSGQLYGSTEQYVLRLDANRTVSIVAGTNNPKSRSGIGGPADTAVIPGPTGIAFDSRSNLYVFEFDGKTVSLITPSGKLTQPFAPQSIYCHGPSGLATAPNGTVFAMGEMSVVRLSPSGQETTIASFVPGVLEGIRGFSPNGIAIGSNGTIYLDTYVGNGFTDRSAIISMSESGTASQVLWEAPTSR